MAMADLHSYSDASLKLRGGVRVVLYSRGQKSSARIVCKNRDNPGQESCDCNRETRSQNRDKNRDNRGSRIEQNANQYAVCYRFNLFPMKKFAGKTIVFFLVVSPGGNIW